MTKYLLAIATVVLLALNLLIGSVHIPLGDIVDILRGHEVANPGYRYIILESRLPQAITALLTGAALATCGLCCRQCSAIHWRVRQCLASIAEQVLALQLLFLQWAEVSSQAWVH